ncbi:MAG: hypothetical protein Q9M14_04640 [Mariprofundaceae bacterium]|nr:hypothetical protein [Mariprofundaceae bacterium]
MNILSIFSTYTKVVLREKKHSLSDAFKLLTQMPSDFMAEGRQDDKPQERENQVH